MRLFYAALALEANTFLPIPTSYQAFVEKLYYPPGKHPEKSGHQTGAIAAARARRKTRRLRADRRLLLRGAARRRRLARAYERMRDEILGQLKAALPVDGAVFNLHGAMVAHGYDDCEGDFLERVRALVGPKARDRRRARPALSSDEEALRRRRRDRAVQGVSAHGFRRARRGDGRSHAAHHPRRDQAGEIRVRLPRDPELPDLDPADARPRRQDHGAGRQEPRAVGLDRALLLLRRRAGMRRAHPGADRRRKAAWRQACRGDRPRTDRVARAGRAARIFRRRRDRCGARRIPAARS